MREFKYVLLCILLFSSTLFAHDVGHGEPLKKWMIKSTNEVIIADFIKYENDEVWLVDDNHAIHILDIQEFNLADQQYKENKSAFIRSVNSNESFENSHEQTPFTYWMILVLGIVFLVYSIYKIRRRKKIIYVAYGILGVGFILFISCKESNNKNTSSVQVPENNVAEMRAFFEKFEQVETHTDDNFFYVSSNGLPKHDMMVGITNWQQQVPISQNYTGDNSWAIPTHPKMAENPLSTKTNLLKGAIAVAVNGIPIFNPLNNRGEDANAIGELDNWGGHCGRADDYHYHLPPLHLQDQVGEGNPVAYVVDGFPVYGKTSKELTSIWVS